MANYAPKIQARGTLILLKMLLRDGLLIKSLYVYTRMVVSMMYNVNSYNGI